MTRRLIWLPVFFLLMLEYKKESTQPDFRLTVRRKMPLLTSQHVFSETPVIDECNRAKIPLTDAVASTLSSCISHFSRSEQSCIYHAGLYSSILPQVLNLVHINSDSCTQGAYSMVSE